MGMMSLVCCWYLPRCSPVRVIEAWLDRCAWDRVTAPCFERQLGPIFSAGCSVPAKRQFIDLAAPA